MTKPAVATTQFLVVAVVKDSNQKLDLNHDWPVHKSCYKSAACKGALSTHTRVSALHLCE